MGFSCSLLASRFLGTRLITLFRAVLEGPRHTANPTEVMTPSQNSNNSTQSTIHKIKELQILSGNLYHSCCQTVRPRTPQYQGHPHCHLLPLRTEVNDSDSFM